MQLGVGEKDNITYASCNYYEIDATGIHAHVYPRLLFPCKTNVARTD